MDSIISTFHLDWKIMIAQLVNFAIVVFVLWYFVFKPLSTKMEERTKTIEKSLAEAKKISENLKNSEQEKQLIIKAARQEAEKIIDESKQIAVEERQKGVAAAKLEVKKVVEEGKAQLDSEKTKMITEVKTQAADLIVAATTKVLGQVVDKKIDREIIEQTLKDLRSKKSV